MIDHVGLRVSDLAAATAFYTRTLAPLGITPVMEVTAEQTGGAAHIGFGAAGKPFFWISSGGAGGTNAAVHVAFAAASRAAVDAFYAAGIEAGARDNGAPGPRPHYHAGYYGAFLLDADGNNIEAVCHRPE